ncbi:MAG: Rrf2 family transcriptional regulator [Olsenella sp.]|nr:Rrf2 family transcriptional regulator [Olsenella sp.]
MNDTRFSTAIHMLVLVSEAKDPMSSEQIAASVGTNASHVRKLATLLRRANVIESRRGAAGFRLVPSPEDLTLLDVYQAVCESERVRVFEAHRNPNDECIVDRHIRPVLDGLFAEASEAVTRDLASRTLADCIARLRSHARAAGDAEPAARKPTATHAAKGQANVTR